VISLKCYRNYRRHVNGLLACYVQYSILLLLFIIRVALHTCMLNADTSLSLSR